MNSVEAWAATAGCEYRFYGDELFERVPDWILDKCTISKLPATDYARLALSRELLEDGYDRVLWVDADVVVFDPQAMAIPWDEHVAFTREIWVDLGPGNRPVAHRQIANAASLFGPCQSTLGFLLERHERFARTARRIDKLDFGTRPLSVMQAEAHWPMIESVGMASGPVLFDLSRGGGRFSRTLAMESGSALAALNLCSSLMGASAHGFTIDDETLDQVAASLLKTRGEVLNGPLC